MRYRSSVRLSLLPALGISATLAIPEAYGQVLEEVLVTARKREENLQEVAVAVSVVSAKTIEDAGLVRLQEISQLVPNMTNTENVSNKATNITLRGISSAGGLGNDPAIGVYVDEVYVARESGFNADLLDIQRVEVLKGPQGTLYGRNSAVGAINITTKRPSDEFEGLVVADAGNYDYQRYGALVSGPWRRIWRQSLVVFTTSEMVITTIPTAALSIRLTTTCFAARRCGRRWSGWTCC